MDEAHIIILQHSCDSHPNHSFHWGLCSTWIKQQQHREADLSKEEFAAPGQNDSSTGRPTFLKKSLFIVFVIADALSLLSSVSATLMFLGILTSPNAAEDFRYSSLKKINIGPHFSILLFACILVAFGSALMIVLGKLFESMYIPITSMGGFLLLMFTILQLPLYFEMVKSTFWPRVLRSWMIWK